MTAPANILVTGGAGYIGSQTCVQLLRAGYHVVVIDNLSNSSAVALDRVRTISGRDLTFHEADLRDAAAVRRVFATHAFDAVIHFAGLKAVGESVQKPLLYYDNNVCGTLRLLEAMDQAAVRRLVFSSSATVYGDPATVPIHEDFPLSATNPYGRSKLFIEDILRDQYRASPLWDIVLLRYFNPVGADPSGLIGEDPGGIPNNLMPYISQVAIGNLDCLSVFGNDYATPDGTGVRDYIHVVDLAKGHLAALQPSPRPGVRTYNLGTGQGYSVLQTIAAFERASGCGIKYCFAPRRAGDVGTCYADPSLAKQELGWQSQHDLDAMCRDAWNWQSRNPRGYRL